MIRRYGCRVAAGVGFALWTRVGVMRGRARLCPVLASDNRAGTVVARGDWVFGLDGIEEEVRGAAPSNIFEGR